MKQPAVTLLSALLSGQVLEFDGMEYRIEEGKLVWRQTGSMLTNHTTGETWEAWHGVDLSVDDFLALAERIPNDQMFLLGANKVLNELHHRKGRH